MKQCMSYFLMSKAGIPASRCNYAVVSLNGERLGIYTVVEPIKKPFLRRHFSSDDGNLYEGTVADFRDEVSWKVRLEKKTNEKEDDWSDVDALTAALVESGDKLEEAVGNEIDIDAFITYWAMELLIGHWDGYATNTNNFIIYRNPEIDKFQFIPWGVDGTFRKRSGNDDTPFLKFVGSMITSRFYNHPELSLRFKKRVAELLDSVLEIDDTMEKLKEIKSILTPHVEMVEIGGFSQTYSEIKEFLYLLDSELRVELQGDLPEYNDSPRSAMCFKKHGELHSTIKTTWGSHPTQNPFLTGSGTFELTVGDTEITSTDVGASAGVPDEEGRENETQILGFVERDNKDLFIILSIIPNKEVADNNTVDLSETESYLLLRPSGSQKADLFSYLQSGTIKFVKGKVEEGAEIKVEYNADIFGM